MGFHSAPLCLPSFTPHYVCEICLCFAYGVVPSHSDRLFHSSGLLNKIGDIRREKPHEIIQAGP